MSWVNKLEKELDRKLHEEAVEGIMAGTHKTTGKGLFVSLEEAKQEALNEAKKILYDT